jgi:hypothetical protein
MAKKVIKEDKTDNYFCSGTLRPSCLKETNLCCLHCDVISKCQALNRKKVKPCTSKNCTLDENCEFSI